MQSPELLCLFQRLAAEIADRDYSNVREESVIADLGLDSLAMLELVGSLERELCVTIPDDGLVGVQTVRELMAVVEERLGPSAMQGNTA